MRNKKIKLILPLLFFQAGLIHANGNSISDDGDIKVVLNDAIIFADEKLSGVARINDVEKIKEFNFDSVIDAGDKIVNDLIKLSASTKFKDSAKVYGDCDLFFLSVIVRTVNGSVQKIDNCKAPLCTKDVFLERKSVFELSQKKLDNHLVDCRAYLRIKP